MVKVNEEDYAKLVTLARRALHTAYAWSDRDHKHPSKTSGSTARVVGLKNIKDSNDFLSRLPQAIDKIRPIA